MYMEKIRHFQENKTLLISYMVMALIPIAVCSIFFYPQIRNRIVEQTSEKAMYQTESVVAELDQQLQIISNIPNRLYENQNLKRMDLEKPWENLTAYTEIRNMIATNNNIKECFLYIRDKTYFISGYQGNISEEKLKGYGGKIGFCYEAWDTEDVISVLDEARNPFWRAAETVTLTGSSQQNIMTYISSVPQNNRFAPWTVMVLVDGDELLGKVTKGIGKEEGYLLYDGDGNLMYASTGVESGVLDYLQGMGTEQILENQSFRFQKNILINAVQSGISGWTLVKVSDLSSMLAHLHSLEKRFFLIILLLALVLSVLGHYFIQINFRPIQQIKDMLMLNGKDEKKHGTEKYYQEIEQAIRILQTDNQRMQQNLKQAAPKMKRHLFSEILSGSLSAEGEKAEKELKEIDAGVIADNYRVAVIHEENPEKLEVLENAVAKQLEEVSTRLLFTEKYGACSKVFVFAEAEHLKEALNCLLGQKEEEKGTQIGIGGTVEGLAKLASSYAQACAALDYAMINSIYQEAVCYEELPDTMFKRHAYPMELIDALAFSVRMGKTEDVKAAVQQILYMMQVREVSPYYTRALFYNVINIFMENEEVYRRYEEEEGDISLLLSQQLSSAQMIEIIKKYCDIFEGEKGNREEKETEWMSQVRLYIEMHASESSLSLTEVSEHIGMSPTWFSTLFKEKGGCSFKEYVDMVRLEKARALLTDTDDTIELIAEKAGYNNSYSFSRFFKKYTGATPNAYRMMKRNV